MVGLICGLCVLCIAMSCVALWYRKQWLFEWGLRRDLQEEWRIENDVRLDLEMQVEELRKMLPKRDSKGRYCKK
jgi:hypothetical protein